MGLIGVWGLGFGVRGLGYGVWNLGFGVWGLEFGGWRLDLGLEFRGEDSRFKVKGLGVRVQGL